MSKHPEDTCQRCFTLAADKELNTVFAVIPESDLSAWKARAERAEARLSHESSQCVLCGVETNNLAGNPSLWPVYFPHKNSDGVCLVHCSGCIAGLLAERDTLKARCENLEQGITQLIASHKISTSQHLCKWLIDGLDELRKQGEEK